MLKFDFDKNLTSKTKHYLGGLFFYIYNQECLSQFVDQINSENGSVSRGINVLYLVHQRSGDHTFMEGIAQKLITNLSKTSKNPFIGITFDSRNHGERIIDATHNSSWRSGNTTHAIDMISGIEGGVQDLKLVMDYLPCILNLDKLLSADLKKMDYKILFNNILCGYSQGAHTVIRFASTYPERVFILNPNIGCADLSTLLINRLKGTKEFDKKLFYKTYEDLELSEENSVYYPEAFHKKLSEKDIQVFENFQFDTIKVFATFYDEDPLVPPEVSRLWIDMCLNSNSLSQAYYESGRLHDISPGMIDAFIKWSSLLI